MAALVSSTNPEKAPDPANGDTVSQSPLEVMALDETTGLYNYYKFFAGKPGERATIMRVERDADDQVYDVVLGPNDAAPTRKPSKKDDGTATRRCFGCHMNGGPLMNELEDPWTNWVSFRQQTLDRKSFSGTTLQLVDESILGPNGRSSFAKGLEDTLKAGMRQYVNGIPGQAGTGYGAAVLEKRAPGGVGKMLRSVFCETELNFNSAFDQVPYELFVDPAAFGAALPPLARVNATEAVPHLLPVRSEMDRRIETFLQRSRILGPSTLLAARLLDEDNDVFSTARCKVFDEAWKGLPAANAEIEPHVRAAIKRAAATIPASPRRTLLDALLDPAATPEALQAAKDAYVPDLTGRYDARTRELDTEAGRAKLKDAVKARKRAALKLLPLPSSPLPEGVISEGK